MTILSYSEPYRLSAGMLALAVHGLFFVLLYFGVNWQLRQPEIMMVELWSPQQEETLVEAAPAEVGGEPSPPPAKVVTPEPIQPVLKPSTRLLADIELRDKKLKEQKADEEAAQKKRREEALARQREMELAQRREAERLEQQRLAEEKRRQEEAERAARQEEERRQAAERQAREQQEREQRRLLAEKRMREEMRIRAEQERIRKEVEAATRAEVERYKERIQNKIRRNIVMPPDVPENAEAKFYVRLLPGGEVVEVRLEQSSGNSAYDSAAERAIYKSRPLPVPSDPELAHLFRELHLYVRP